MECKKSINNFRTAIFEQYHAFVGFFLCFYYAVLRVESRICVCVIRDNPVNLTK